MDYEFRGRSGSGSYVSGGDVGGDGSSLYPRVGQPSYGAAAAPQRAAPYHHVTASPSSPAFPAPAPSSSSSSTSVKIPVVIKPEYRISPPPQLAPQMVEVPRSTFNFDFEYERKILAEAEKENPSWGKFVVQRQTPPPQQPQPPRGPRHTTSTTSMAAPVDPVVEKYISLGLGREAVSFAVLNYGDNPTKVKEFVKSYNALHEMGFTTSNIPELLAIHDNDPDKVIQHLAAPVDPVVEKYISLGLGREAVSFAVLNYGDNPTKVKEFVKSYNALHEMGFTTSNIPELLAIHDNDPDKVIQHLVP